MILIVYGCTMTKSALDVKEIWKDRDHVGSENYERWFF